MIPHLSDRMLVERLKELELAGVVKRTVYPETPVRVEYELTQQGQELLRRTRRKIGIRIVEP